MLIKAPNRIERRSGRHRLLTTALAESDALHRFARNPDGFMQLYGGDVLKHDKSSTVVSTSFDGHAVVIKRFNNRNLFHPVKRALRRSRAELCFDNALLLDENQIPTPEPLAAVEQRYGPVRGGAWFVTRKIDGVDLIEWFRKEPTPGADHTVVQQVLQLFQFFENHKIAHGDLKATNLFVAREKLFVLDLDSMRRYQSELVHRDRLARDARRFLKNWRKQANISELFVDDLQPLLDAEPPQSQWFRQRLR